MAVELVFRAALNTSHPVDLVFGSEETEGPKAALVAFNVALPGPRVEISLIAGVRDLAEFYITMPQIAAAFVGVYDVAIPSSLQSFVASSWQGGRPERREPKVAYAEALDLVAARSAGWGQGTARDVLSEVPWQQSDQQRHEAAARWVQSERGEGAAASPAWQTATGRGHDRGSVWQEGAVRRARQVATRWQDMDRGARPALRGLWAGALAERSDRRFGFARHGRPLGADSRSPWQEASGPRPGKSPVIEPPVEPPFRPCYRPPLGRSVHLLFDEPWDGSGELVFRCDHGGDAGVPAHVVVPIRKVYFVLNDTSLWRVDGGAPIPTFTMSMGLDVDSWTWSFNASVPGSALPQLVSADVDEPIELEARINGVAYRFLAESLSRDRTFGSSRVNVRGRGRLAVLDAPYAPLLSFGNADVRTAQQLMHDVLTINGASLGWTIDWQLDDWVVPGGAWATQGSYMQALNAIAQAAGGYVQPERVSQGLRVLHRYPTAPWEWNDVAPDFELPADVATREGIEWTSKPSYTRVFVSGQASGVLGQVTRAGTDGTSVAQMITDPLMTDAIAIRQRGRTVLSDTGAQANVSLRLPVLTSTGVIEPGKFVRYVDGGATRLGIVRSTAVEVAMPEVWQTIGVETHVQ